MSATKLGPEIEATEMNEREARSKQFLNCLQRRAQANADEADDKAPGNIDVNCRVGRNSGHQMASEPATAKTVTHVVHCIPKIQPQHLFDNWQPYQKLEPPDNIIYY